MTDINETLEPDWGMSTIGRIQYIHHGMNEFLHLFKVPPEYLAKLERALEETEDEQR